MKCNASLKSYNYMQYHLGNASIFKNLPFTLVATQREGKEKG